MKLARSPLALAVLLACGESGQPPQKKDPAPRVDPVAPQQAVAEVRSAVRCAECHEPYVRGWEASAHAQAAASPYYRALGGGDDPRCDRCHQPLRAALDRDEPIHEEGVTCDACHAIRDVKLDAGVAAIDFDLTSNRKYGPLCDARDHYFHRVGCSSLHAESRFCAACHTLAWPTQAGPKLPVITDFDEWQANDLNSSSCQECHMAGEPGEVARGWITRENVSRHDLFGNDLELRRIGVGLRATLSPEEDALWLDVEVTNLAAAHSIPAGLAGRRLVLLVRALDPEGAELGREERSYARILVDGEGQEAPFIRAIRVESDSRLAPGERRHERFKVPAAAASASVEVLRRGVAPAVAEALGITPAADSQVAAVDVAIERKDRRYSGSGRRPRSP